jgi:hypothetical protein
MPAITPRHDHRILASVDADRPSWIASSIAVPAEVVAIAGKSVRRSGGKAGRDAIHRIPFRRATASGAGTGPVLDRAGARRKPHVRQRRIYTGQA